MHRRFVSIFILSTFVVWILIDVWLNSHGGPTESQQITIWGKESVFWPFLMGFLSGHWFFTRKNPSGYRWIAALGIWAALIGWDLWFHYGHLTYTAWRYGGLWFVLGVPAGMYLWGQTDQESPIA